MHFMVLKFEWVVFPPRNMCYQAYFQQKNKNPIWIAAHFRPGPAQKSNPADPFSVALIAISEKKHPFPSSPPKLKP